MLAFKKSLRNSQKPVRNGLLFLLGIYRTIGTTYLGGSCRHVPSCSEYANEALLTLPVPRALGLIFYRILRCNPFGTSGFDPVPVQKRTTT